MALNRDMESFHTVYSEVDMSDKEKLELIRIRQRRGHEIIKSYPDLKNFFKGNLKLATPILTQSGDIITKVQYSVDANRDDIEKISAFEFNDSIRDQVKQEFENFKNLVKETGNSNDDRQKKLLIQSFTLPENFDEDGFNYLIKVGSIFYLLNWGFYHLDTDDVIVLPPTGPDLKIKLSKVDNEDSVSIKAELSADAKDYNFEWEIEGDYFNGQSGKTLKINSAYLQKLDEEFKIKLRVRHSERHTEVDTKTEWFHNPFYSPDSEDSTKQKIIDEGTGGRGETPEQPPDFLTVKIFSSGKLAYNAELNKDPDYVETVDYEWNLNGDQVIGNSDYIKLEHEHLKGLPRNSKLYVTVTGFFDGNEEEATAIRELKISLWDRFLAWWSDPDNRKKLLIALALILFILLLIYWFNRNPTSSRSTGSDRPTSQTSQNGPDVLTPGIGSQRADRANPNESGVPPSDRSDGPPSGSDSITPSAPGRETLPPQQDQNEPAPPFTPRGNNAENDLSPNQIREIESSPGTGPTKIGDIFCVESAGKVKVWMELSGRNIYILDSYSSEQGDCSQYYPGN